MKNISMRWSQVLHYCGRIQLYLNQSHDYQKDRKQFTHFLGIGGDELFTPMPSNPWEYYIVKFSDSLYALKYSLIMRRPFFVVH